MAVSIIKFKADEYDRDGLLSVAQVAAKCALSESMIRKQIRNGSLTAYSLVGKYVLKPVDVERWVLINQIKVIGVPQNARMQTRLQAAV